MEFGIRAKPYVSFGALVLQAARPKPVLGERDSTYTAGSETKIEAEGRSL